MSPVAPIQCEAQPGTKLGLGLPHWFSVDCHTPPSPYSGLVIPSVLP